MQCVHESVAIKGEDLWASRGPKGGEKVHWFHPVMWKRKRKLEAEAPEAAIFYRSGSGSGSGKHEMNGSVSRSESSKKILEAEAEAEAIKNSPLPHHWLKEQHNLINWLSSSIRLEVVGIWTQHVRLRILAQVLPKGEWLVQQNQVVSSIFILKSGMLKISTGELHEKKTVHSHLSQVCISD